MDDSYEVNYCKSFWFIYFGNIFTSMLLGAQLEFGISNYFKNNNICII